MHIRLSYQQKKLLDSIAAFYNIDFKTALNRCLVIGLSHEGKTEEPSGVNFDPTPILEQIFSTAINHGILQLLHPKNIHDRLKLEEKVHREAGNLIQEIESWLNENPSSME